MKLKAKVKSIGILAFSISSLLACGADKSQSSTELSTVERQSDRVGMNDVSILFPLAKNEAEIANGFLNAASQGPMGTLFPKNIYAQGEFANIDGDLQYKNLKAVAFRLDPCFAQIGPITHPENCQNQLRIIFQSIEFHNGSSFARDSAIHAFYSISRQQLLDAVREVVALRLKSGKADSSGPLAVHPILVQEGLTGPIAQGLNAIFLKYAGERNLVRFTKFTAGNAGVTWNFSGFDVVDGKLKKMSIPAPDQTVTTASHIFGGFGFPLDASFAPLPAKSDDFSLLMRVQESMKAPHAAQQAAFDATFRIENPEIHSPESTSCGACHATAIARDLAGFAGLKLEPSDAAKVFQPDSRFVTADDMRLTTPMNHQGSPLVNVHAFSYQSAEPMINPRVVNETAAVVSMINLELRPKTDK